MLNMCTNMGTQWHEEHREGLGSEWLPTQMGLMIPAYCRRYSSWETFNYKPCCQNSLLCWCVLSFYTFPPLTHWFLDNPVVVRGVVCVHWLQERPSHFMCLQRRAGPRGRKGKTRHLRKLKPMKKNKQHHENDTGSRWVNTDVLSCFLPHFFCSHTHTQTTGERRRE